MSAKAKPLEPRREYVIAWDNMGGVTGEIVAFRWIEGRRFLWVRTHGILPMLSRLPQMRRDADSLGEPLEVWQIHVHGAIRLEPS